MNNIGKKLKRGDLYAVHTGSYAGEMLLYIKQEKNTCCFLSIPNLINRNIDNPVVIRGIEGKILQYVENVPKYVLKTSIKQYNYNEKANNRRQQPNSPNFLGIKDASS